jgi:hypothetical protein
LESPTPKNQPVLRKKDKEPDASFDRGIPKGCRQAPAGKCLEGEISMDRVDESERTAPGTTVLPVLIQIQGPPSVIRAEKARRRRIGVILDHPVSRHLGIFSWLMVGVAMAATRPMTAVIAAVVILTGLLIGAINSLRWLFGAK